MLPGTLYLIPNTLASPGEIPQALDAVIPQEVQKIVTGLDYFIAENAKSARGFLKACGTSIALQSIDIQTLNVNTPSADIDNLLTPLMSGRDAGLLSEAGCPAVADPGANLVRLAHERGVKVRPLVGPSSLLLALMGSGLDGQSFSFHGYLPTEVLARQKKLRELERDSKEKRQTQLFIETPYRNPALFEAMLSSLSPSTRVTVATDLTLPSELIKTLYVRDWKLQPTPDIKKKPTVFLLLA